MRFLKFTLIKAMLVVIFAGINPVMAQSVITSNLQERLNDYKSGDMIRINIRLEEQYDTELMNAKTTGIKDRELRREIVVNELKNFSKESQKDIMAFLANQEKSLNVQQVMQLWIVNLINCYATPEVIQQLAEMPGIARIDYDQERQVLDLEEVSAPLAEPDVLDFNPNTAWNVDLVNAPDVWEQGFIGEGIVVSVLDTGVNPNHLDLAGRMWVHPNYPNHGYNFVNNNYDTSDNQSHGTHCAGTVAGNGTAGTTTGIAPGATIMALKVLSDTGSGTEAGVWAGIQFSVDYGAHIMSLSLGWPQSWNPDRAAWRIVMTNAMEAGVIAAVAAGNEGGWGGPAPPSNVRTPGDVPAPWTHPDQIAPGTNSAVVTVGSTTNTDAISSFSSRGPVTWQNIAPFNDYPFNPGTGLILPDVVAPGSNILSLTNDNNSGYTTKSGTSMATPAVAGVMALMLSKNPKLTPEQISQILEETALPLSTGKSNTFGSGRVDALAAIEATPFWGIRYVDHIVNDEAGNNDGKINPAETILLGITFENPTEDDVTDASVSISSDSEFITFTDSTAFLGNFEAGEIIDFADIFSFDVSEIIPGSYEIQFTLYVTSPDSEDTWRSGFSISAYAPRIEFLEMIVDDSEFGNDNGRLDPGETADIIIPIKNTGQQITEDIVFNVESNSPWITFGGDTEFELSGLEPEETFNVSFQVTALAQTPLENIAELEMSVNSGPYHFEETMDLVIGLAPVYSDGDIPSTYNTNVTTGSNALSPGVITVNIPEGAIINSVDVEYKITSQGGGWMSEQRSFLRCVTEGGTTESSVAHGPSQNSGGTHEYNRTGLTIANGIETGGDIVFELHVFRTWGGTGSSTQYAYVPNNTWKVIVHYELAERDVTLRVVNQLDEVVEGAIIEVNEETKETDEQGEVEFLLTAGSHFYNFSAYKHKPVVDGIFVVHDLNAVAEVLVERVFGVIFNVVDADGEPFENAVIKVNDEVIDGIEVEHLPNGIHSYEISAEGYQTVSGAVFMNSKDVEITETMLPLDVTSVEQLTQGTINVYPNPAQNHVTVRFEDGGFSNTSISLFNHLGQAIRYISPEVSENQSQVEIDLNEVKAGIYLIQIDNGTEIINKKLIVQ